MAKDLYPVTSYIAFKEAESSMVFAIKPDRPQAGTVRQSSGLTQTSEVRLLIDRRIPTHDTYGIPHPPLLSTDLTVNYKVSLDRQY